MFVKVKAGKELVRVKVTKVYANGEGEGEVYGNPQNPNLSGATRHYYGDTIRFRTKQGQPKMVRKIESEPEMTQHPVNMMQAVHSPYYSRLPNQRKQIKLVWYLL